MIMDCVECYAPTADDSPEGLCAECRPAEQLLPWLDPPTDVTEIVTAARNGVIESVNAATAHPAAVAKLTITVTVPPEQGPEPPGARPPLEEEPCDCKPGCKRKRIVGYRLCHPCKATFLAENYEFHVLTHDMPVTEMVAAWKLRDEQRKAVAR